MIGHGLKSYTGTYFEEFWKKKFSTISLQHGLISYAHYGDIKFLKHQYHQGTDPTSFVTNRQLKSICDTTAKGKGIIAQYY